MDYALSRLLKGLLPIGITKGVLPLYLEGHVTEASIGIARVCSGIFNYCMNRLVFGKKDRAAKSGSKYLALWFVQMLLTAGLMKLLVDVLQVNYTLSYLVVNTVLFFISFKIQQVWVFKKEKGS